MNVLTTQTSKIALILVTLICFNVFFSCAKSEPDNTSTTLSESPITSNTAISDTVQTEQKKGFSVSNEKEEIPESDFKDTNFVILIDDPAEQVWTYTNMVVEEETGDSIDDAYYRRNRAVEEKLNITIKQTVTSLGAAQTNFKKRIIRR